MLVLILGWLCSGYVDTGAVCDRGLVVAFVLGCLGLGYAANSSASVLHAALFGTSWIMRGGGGGGWFAKNRRGGGLEVVGESGRISLMIMIVIGMDDAAAINKLSKINAVQF